MIRFIFNPCSSRFLEDPQILLQESAIGLRRRDNFDAVPSAQQVRVHEVARGRRRADRHGVQERVVHHRQVAPDGVVHEHRQVSGGEAFPALLPIVVHAALPHLSVARPAVGRVVSMGSFLWLRVGRDAKEHPAAIPRPARAGAVKKVDLKLEPRWPINRQGFLRNSDAVSLDLKVLPGNRVSALEPRSVIQLTR